MQECPIISTIKEIHGSGIYIDEVPDAQILILGGNDKIIQYVCDEASYHLSVRMIQVARAKFEHNVSSISSSISSSITTELISNDTNTNTNIIDELFNHLKDKSQEEIFSDIVGNLSIKKHLCNKGYLTSTLIVELQRIWRK